MPNLKSSKPLRIYEHKFSVSHPLMQNLFGEVSTKMHPKAYCQAVYFNKNNPKIVAAKLVYLKSPMKETKSFISFLTAELSFDECLIISTLYYSQKQNVIETILQSSDAEIDEDLEFLLKSTNGYIIYCYQFEQLAQLVLCISQDESIEVRKKYNKIQSSIENLNVDKKKLLQFKEIVKSRLITNSVRYPNYSGAKNLMTYAKSRFGSDKKVE